MAIYRIEAGLKIGRPDPAAATLQNGLKSQGLPVPGTIRAARVYWVELQEDAAAARNAARAIFSDPVVEDCAVNAPLYDESGASTLEITRKHGVMDPAVASILKALSDLGLHCKMAATGKKFLLHYAPGTAPSPETLRAFARKSLYNECVEEMHLNAQAPVHGASPAAGFKLTRVPLTYKNDAELIEISKQGCLSLTLDEMRTIQAHFRTLNREPSDAELETVAQTWSEHCRHKTLRGHIVFDGPDGKRVYQNLIKETIFRATEVIAHKDCLSVFKDNAGVVAFDENWALTFKVETHNHPSAIEPYGGAGTGLGGVIRDTLGTGLGAKPIANTDVFCFGMPDSPADELPAGTLHPARVMAGVVSGVRDYGNRMGIPTVNGAVHFDPRYVGNPLVYCGSVGLIPRNKIEKAAKHGDLVVVMGGRTGRDGIHGATFSSVELTEHSETVSSGAVQIGNAIEEKKILDVLLKARDLGLFTCVTDCGAGGLSSAIGEMGEETGASVDLDKVPLKYAGLTYTEIWISEAQERMVMSVPPAKWAELDALCKSEEVEATAIGTFGTENAMLKLFYKKAPVADISMAFLHGGIPSKPREARWHPPIACQGESNTLVMMDMMKDATGLDSATLAASRENPSLIYNRSLRALLGHPTIASKQWIIRQYDHEVQGRTVGRPLTGVKNDGPADAAVILPLLDDTKGAAIGCGLCPQFTERDPREMARLAVDECMRNIVAVGGNPDLVYILDNFSWGNTSKPDQLGSLVLACEGCTEAAIAFGAPFISGKDSLNNEYAVGGKTIAIPGTLLISGLAIVNDVRRTVSMDLKRAGNHLYAVGLTKDELGGSHFNLVSNVDIRAGTLPRTNLKQARTLYHAMHNAIESGLIRACHDCSEGGLAVALAEMCIAGCLGASIDTTKVPVPRMIPPHVVLFSESPSRFIVEVTPENAAAFESALTGMPHARIGEVLSESVMRCTGPDGQVWLQQTVDEMRTLWNGAF